MDSERLDKNINWKRLHDWVKHSLKEDKTGHDYEHVKRVLKTSFKIAETHNDVDYDVLVAAALLHDISYKDGHAQNHHIKGAEESEEIVRILGFSEDKIRRIKMAIEDHVAHLDKPIRSDDELQIESKILRDADNIDALGAIGLARQINFCNSRDMPYFKSKEDKINESVYGGVKSIITWADKLLLAESKRMGEKRVKIMRDFLVELESEYS